MANVCLPPDRRLWQAQDRTLLYKVLALQVSQIELLPTPHPKTEYVLDAISIQYLTKEDDSVMGETFIMLFELRAGSATGEKIGPAIRVPGSGGAISPPKLHDLEVRVGKGNALWLEGAHSIFTPGADKNGIVYIEYHEETG